MCDSTPGLLFGSHDTRRVGSLGACLSPLPRPAAPPPTTPQLAATAPVAVVATAADVGPTSRLAVCHGTRTTTRRQWPRSAAPHRPAPPTRPLPPTALALVRRRRRHPRPLRGSTSRALPSGCLAGSTRWIASPTTSTAATRGRCA